MLKRIKSIQVLDVETGEKSTMDILQSVVKTQYNNIALEKTYEQNNGISKTIPNQAMTVKELIARFASGLPLNLGKVPIYEGDDENLTDLDAMDRIELHNYVKDLKEQRDAAASRVSEARTKAEELKMEKIIAERVEKRIKDNEEKLAGEYRKTLKPRTNKAEE